ncbi:MAG: 30S ribosomal protein S15 [Rickettsiales bacterium]|nr:30S ribosomal protein S15 [Rickettsiales bacterium]OUV54036.1 MAG: 30S ribosomal protein S15 [Rickettsiales bacterium TMED127]|tara:strand:- start:46123 stop:46392 length:270 start_codon:yes stop_codon:yes gene_type:complete
MSITKTKKHELTKKYAKDPKDTGSTNVQVAILSERIKNLTEHLKLNKKDQSTRRGLLKMVGKRKKLLSYLKDKSNDTYKGLIKNLGLRH